jgi:hypothetical protein
MTKQPTETNGYQSMRAFCEKHGLRRPTVIEWCNERNKPTDKGVSTDLALEILAAFRPELATQETAIALLDETGMARQSDIPTIPTERLNALDSMMERFKPQAIAPVELNGAQDSVMQGIEILAAMTQMKEEQLRQREASLTERLGAVQKQRKVIEAMREYNQGLDQRIEATDAVAQQLAEEESKLLGELKELGIKPNPE